MRHESWVMSRKARSEGELGFLRWVRRRLHADRRVIIGPGDDAAVVRLADPRVVIHVDNTVEGIHYPRGTPWGAVGWKAVMRCASDIAAMGCRPVGALVGAVLPARLGRAGRRALVSGMERACRAADISLVGGDLTAGKGPAVLSATLFGEIPAGCRPVRRAGARPGDLVAVTGRLGGAILGRHLRVRPRLGEALALQRGLTLHAMIDVSDGLAADLGHILEESGVGCRLDAARVPIHPDARKLARRTGRTPLAHALSDGEDYELLFAFPRAQAARLPGLSRRLGAPITVIGGITEKGQSAPLRIPGYQHRW